MLTVKWIVRTKHGEVIRIYEAREVALAFRDAPPPPPSAPVQASSHWLVHDRTVERSLMILDPSEPNFAGRSFDTGIVYVMNDTGATVGKYVLDNRVIEDAHPLEAAPDLAA